MDSATYVTSDRFIMNRTHDLLTSKWKVYIIYFIGDRIYRFGELKRAFHFISRSTLTKYLQELERDGFLNKWEDASLPLRTEYSLTQLGTSVYPLLNQLVGWGDN